jgi:hypothetical protein
LAFLRISFSYYKTESGIVVVFLDYRGLRWGHKRGLPKIGVSYLIRKRGFFKNGGQELITLKI